MPMLRRRGGTCTPRSGAATLSPPIEIVPRGRLFEAGDAAQGRGLAAAGRPEQHDDLARRDAEAHVVDRGAADQRTACADARRSVRRTFNSCIPHAMHASVIAERAWTPAWPRMRASSLACTGRVTAGTRTSCSTRRAILLQPHELFVFRHPHLHDVGIEAFRIERRLLERGEVAELLDHHRLAFLGEAPVEEQPRGVRVGGGLR